MHAKKWLLVFGSFRKYAILHTSLKQSVEKRHVVDSRLVFNEYFLKFLVKLYNEFFIVWASCTKFRQFFGKSIQWNFTKKFPEILIESQSVN